MLPTTELSEKTLVKLLPNSSSEELLRPNPNGNQSNNMLLKLALTFSENLNIDQQVSNNSEIEI